MPSSEKQRTGARLTFHRRQFFWPGGGSTEFAAFYSYGYPAPADFADAKVMPDWTYFDPKLGEFLLPYDVVRQSAAPEVALTALESTYLAAADLNHWDRMALDCPTGVPRRPRPLS